ncbi:MAG: cbb3-type cytochrome c oxidase subunit I [Bryobacteraceae bacterium]
MTDASGGATPLSPWWRHSAILVMIAGFSVLSFLTVLTYTNAPPIPEKAVDMAGNVVFTGADIQNGQEVFLKHGLMEHGSLWGHGAYLGPDYSAEYLHRLSEVTRDTIAMEKYGRLFARLSPDEQSAASAQTRRLLKENRYEPASRTLVLTAGEVAAYRSQTAEWSEYFTKQGAAPGLPASYIKNPVELKALSAYFAWAAWAASATRPGKDYSYTNNWPYEPLAGNTPSTEAYVWSALSLITLLGGLGLILFLVGKFDYLGWKGDGAGAHNIHSAPAPLRLTPSQWATGWFFAIVALLFLAQSFLGGVLAHYRVEPGSFYGIDIARFLPYTLARTWHLQLAIFWIATAWVGGGLFLAPWVGGSEPARQRTGVYALLGALVVVVAGSLFGEYLGLNDKLGQLWFWLGHQGSEYLDLGRLWQLLLAAGLVLWLFLMFRALRPAIQNPGKRELSSLFLYAAVAIPVFYLPALFYGPHSNFAVIDNWRFWIIHLWVEGFFELFATVLVAIMFHQMGVVSTKTATRVIYLDAILYLGAGIIGTGHHWYFTGQGTLNMGLAACFSAMEVVPLTLLTLDAWDFIKLKNEQCTTCGHDLASAQKWAIYFLMAVGVWNFVGAGIFGFLINLPIVSYFEIGTTLTANHGHAALFGVFGMLALAVLVFCLRAMQSDAVWKRTEKFIRVGFWGANVGLALMILLDLFPGGVLQLWDSIANGYWHARRLTFLTGGLYHKLEWVRMVGDTIFILAGAVPIALGALRSVWKRDLLPTA